MSSLAKRVLLVAQDFAPQKAFHPFLADALGEKGLQVQLVLGGKGPPTTGQILGAISAVRDCDILVCGMSSSSELATAEIAAAEEAVAGGIPFGFYADTFGVVNRPWFMSKALQGLASFVFVVNQEEARNAKTLFPNVDIVVSGNPEWEEFAFPEKTREEVRTELKVILREHLILCPGGKSLAVNILHFGAVIGAVRQLVGQKRVILSLHPKDPNPVELYKELVELSSVPLQVAETSTLDILPGVDLVVQSASTIGVAAAIQRIPVIDFFSEIALARMEKVTGAREWKLCQKGVSKAVCSYPTTLADWMNAYLGGPFGRLTEEMKIMRQNQEKVFPKPSERGAAVRIMADHIEKVVGSE